MLNHGKKSDEASIDDVQMLGKMTWDLPALTVCPLFLVIPEKMVNAEVFH